jgi:hypothetical protein
MAAYSFPFDSWQVLVVWLFQWRNAEAFDDSLYS